MNIYISLSYVCDSHVNIYWEHLSVRLLELSLGLTHTDRRANFAHKQTQAAR